MKPVEVLEAQNLLEKRKYILEKLHFPLKGGLGREYLYLHHLLGDEDPSVFGKIDKANKRIVDKLEKSIKKEYIEFLCPIEDRLEELGVLEERTNI